MRFDEPDVREAYRRGARDCLDAVITDVKPQKAREIEAWLSELDGWEHGEPPPAPLGLAHF